MSNSSSVSLPGLLSTFVRRLHLADVVHQRRQPELAQQAALDAEARVPGPS
jgi:hypothetical protein